MICFSSEKVNSQQQIPFESAHYLKCGPPGTNPVIQNFSVVAVLPYDDTPGFSHHNQTYFCDVYFAPGSKFRRISSSTSTSFVAIRRLVINDVELYSDFRDPMDAFFTGSMPGTDAPGLNLLGLPLALGTTEQQPGFIIIDNLRVTLVNVDTNRIGCGYANILIFARAVDLSQPVPRLYDPHDSSSNRYVSTITIRNSRFIQKDSANRARNFATLGMDLTYFGTNSLLPPLESQVIVRGNITFENNYFESDVANLIIATNTRKVKDNNNNNNDNEGLVLFRNNSFVSIAPKTSLCPVDPDPAQSNSLYNCVRLHQVLLSKSWVDNLTFYNNTFFISRPMGQQTTQLNFFLVYVGEQVLLSNNNLTSDFYETQLDKNNPNFIRKNDVHSKGLELKRIEFPNATELFQKQSKSFLVMVLITNNTFLIRGGLYSVGINFGTCSFTRYGGIVLNDNYIEINNWHPDSRHSLGFGIGETESPLNYTSLVGNIFFSDNRGLITNMRTLPARFYEQVDRIMESLGTFYTSVFGIGQMYWVNVTSERNDFTLRASNPEKAVSSMFGIGFISGFPFHFAQQLVIRENRFILSGTTHIISVITPVSDGTNDNVRSSFFNGNVPLNIFIERNYYDGTDCQLLPPAVYPTLPLILQAIIPAEAKDSSSFFMSIRCNAETLVLRDNTILQASVTARKPQAAFFAYSFEEVFTLRNVTVSGNTHIIYRSKSETSLNRDAYWTNTQFFLIFGPYYVLAKNNVPLASKLTHFEISRNNITVESTGEFGFTSISTFPVHKLIISENTINVTASWISRSESQQQQFSKINSIVLAPAFSSFQGYDATPPTFLQMLYGSPKYALNWKFRQDVLAPYTSTSAFATTFYLVGTNATALSENCVTDEIVISRNNITANGFDWNLGGLSIPEDSLTFVGSPITSTIEDNRLNFRLGRRFTLLQPLSPKLIVSSITQQTFLVQRNQILCDSKTQETCSLLDISTTPSIYNDNFAKLNLRFLGNQLNTTTFLDPTKAVFKFPPPLQQQEQQNWISSLDISSSGDDDGKNICNTFSFSPNYFSLVVNSWILNESLNANPKLFEAFSETGCSPRAKQVVGRTTQPTRTPSAELPPKPVFSKTALQQASDATQATSMALFAAASPVVPSLSFGVARQQATMNFLYKAKSGDCTGISFVEEDEGGNVPPPAPAAADSPTQLAFGSDAAKYYVGGAIGNVIFTLAVCLLIQLFGHLYLKVTGSSSWNKPYSVWARCHVSLVFFVLTSLLLAPTLTFALVAAALPKQYLSSTVLKIISLIFALLFFTAPTIYYAIWCIFLRKEQPEKYRHFHVPTKREQQEQERKRQKASCWESINASFDRFVVFWFQGPGEWQIGRRVSEDQHLDFDSALPMIDGYSDRAKWFGLVEYAVQIGLALSAFLPQLVPVELSCTMEAILLCVSLGSYVLLSIYFRPFQELFSRIALPIAALLQMLIVILAIVMVGNIPDWIETIAVASSSLQTVLAILTVVASLGPLLKPLLRVLRRLRRLVQKSKEQQQKEDHQQNLRNKKYNYMKRHPEATLRALIQDSSDEDNDNVVAGERRRARKSRLERGEDDGDQTELRTSRRNVNRFEEGAGANHQQDILYSGRQLSTERKRKIASKRKSNDDEVSSSQKPSALPTSSSSPRSSRRNNTNSQRKSSSSRRTTNIDTTLL